MVNESRQINITKYCRLAGCPQTLRCSYLQFMFKITSDISGAHLVMIKEEKLCELHVKYTIFFSLFLGPVQTSNFTCAESNANDKNIFFSLICIRFGTCKVRRLNRALERSYSVFRLLFTVLATNRFPQHYFPSCRKFLKNDLFKVQEAVLSLFELCFLILLQNDYFRFSAFSLLTTQVISFRVCPVSPLTTFPSCGLKGLTNQDESMGCPKCSNY